MKLVILLLGLLFFLTRCSSLMPQGRQFLDSSTHKDSPPDWVRDTKVSWESKDRINLRSSYTIRGDVRLNGCFDLAKMDGKEAILSEIANEVRGTLDNAQQSLSENAETVLGKARSSEFSGRITGLRFTDQYFERYLVGETERIDCRVLGQVDASDYKRLKRELVDRIAAADPRIKDAIAQKHLDFFKKTQQEGVAKSQRELAEAADK